MPPKIDETGKTFGEWFVLKYIEPRDRLPENKTCNYLAKCFCGVERPIRISDLRSGKSKSCGHLSQKKWNIQLGKTYGKLTPLEQLTNRHGNFIQKYLCKCSCGNTIIVDPDNIGRKKNCGCEYAKNNNIPFLEIDYSRGKESNFSVIDNEIQKFLEEIL